jgi:hypothetical protein
LLPALCHSNDALPSPYQVTLVGLSFACKMPMNRQTLSRSDYTVNRLAPLYVLGPLSQETATSHGFVHLIIEGPVRHLKELDD